MANFCTQCGKSAQPGSTYCIQCGNKLTGEGSRPKAGLQTKRDRVLGKTRSNKKPKLIFLAALGVLLVYSLLNFMGSLPSSANPIIEEQPTISSALQYPNSPTQMAPIDVRVEDGKIIIPLDEVQSRKFVAFDYQKLIQGIQVPLLAYISEEGKLVTAVSMCEPCNSKRFHIRGSNLVCNSCGTTWEVGNLSGVSGSCQKYPPDAIPSVVSGNEIIIDESIVAAWQPRI